MSIISVNFNNQDKLCKLQQQADSLRSYHIMRLSKSTKKITLEDFSDDKKDAILESGGVVNSSPTKNEKDYNKEQIVHKGFTFSDNPYKLDKHSPQISKSKYI